MLLTTLLLNLTSRDSNKGNWQKSWNCRVDFPAPVIMTLGSKAVRLGSMPIKIDDSEVLAV
jgi:energy-converting hydrogenase Eha subunit A